MHWNHDDEMILLVLVLAPEDSWIILCDHGEGAATPVLDLFQALYRVGP
jgi:hypothetical protein